MPIIVAINKIDIASDETIDGAFYHIGVQLTKEIYNYLHRAKLLSKKITRLSNPTKQKNPPPPFPVRYCFVFISLDSQTAFPIEAVVEISALNGTGVDVITRELFARSIFPRFVYLAHHEAIWSHLTWNLIRRLRTLNAQWLSHLYPRWHSSSILFSLFLGTWSNASRSRALGLSRSGTKLCYWPT